MRMFDRFASRLARVRERRDDVIAKATRVNAEAWRSVTGVTEDDWKGHLRREYAEVRTRWDRINRLLKTHDNNPASVRLPCPEGLLNRQLRVMGEYLDVLRERAECAGISLPDDTEEEA